MFVTVAIPTPLYREFDYRWVSPRDAVRGGRVSVPFGPRKVIGIVLSASNTTEVPEARLKSVSQVLDSQPVLAEEVMDLLCWASRYYQYPLGEVLSSALPALLRKGHAATITEREFYRWIADEPRAENFKRSPLQMQIAQYLHSLSGKLAGADSMARLSSGWRRSMDVLIAKGWVQREVALKIPDNKARGLAPVLAEEQQLAVEQITTSLSEKTGKRFLLNGVTGSGKTEVYLRCISRAQSLGLQVLVLVPEISLTPQLMSRFEQRIDGCLVSLHSSLNDTERLQNWLCASQGYADVVIGTRSSILAPMPRLGLIIVDEEHDGSFKQQEGFRYHARDLALMRAKAFQCPVVLGSATPSFESLNNVDNGKLVELLLSERAGGARPPTMGLMDIRRRKLVEGLSDRMIDAIRQHLDSDGQVLMFINRRGFAPTLLCNDCGAAVDCKRCDAHMTVHSRTRRLRCHYCGSERQIPVHCEACGSKALDSVGYGTERIANVLAERFPDVPITRIDRDTTRRKGALEEQLARATSGEARILVGTQMLAKGHHFPKLTLVGILDADRGLFGTDFRSLEQMGQLILQVAGRAGREKDRGTVLVQTRNPDNPMLQTLVAEGYAPFATIAMSERRLAELPPFSFMALVRAEASTMQEPYQFLLQVADSLRVNNNTSMQLEVLGPAPAPMERLGGRYRVQLLVQSDKRSSLNDSLFRLSRLIDKLPGARRCRWSIDVDPVDLF